MKSVPSSNSVNPLEILVNRQIAQTVSRLTSGGDLRELDVWFADRSRRFGLGSVVGSKECQQDAMAVWTPQQPSHGLYWAAAVADGVSTSLFSDLASRVAVVEALQAVKQAYEQLSPRITPLAKAQRSLTKLGEVVEDRGGLFKPRRVSRLLWDRIIEQRRLLQTTLTVAWEDSAGLHLEGVGDGGFALGFHGDSDLLLFKPGSLGPVQCLGPHVAVADGVWKLDIAHWQRLAVFTDGASELLSEAEEHQQSSGLWPGMLLRLLEASLEDLEDNATVLLVEKGAA